MADKHHADPWMRPRTLLESVMSDGLSAHRHAIHEALRRIPVLEAERDALHEARFRESAEMGLEIEELKAERDELRADADRYRGLRAAVLAESPGMTASEADADVDANLADRSA